MGGTKTGMTWRSKNRQSNDLLHNLLDPKGDRLIKVGDIFFLMEL